MRLFSLFFAPIVVVTATSYGKSKTYVGKSKKTHHSYFTRQIATTTTTPIPITTTKGFPSEYQCTPPMVECPPGFTLTGDICENSVITPPDFFCTTGALSADSCISTVQATPMCAEGFTLQPDGCAKTEYVPRIPYCPDGTVDTGITCEKKIPAPVVHVCEIGTKEDEICVETQFHPVTVTSYCPESYQEEDGECCRIDTYDCTPPGAKPLECSDDDTSEACTSFGRRLRSCRSNLACVSRVRKEFQQVQRKEVEHVIQKTCQKRVVAPMMHHTFCEQGEMKGNACIVEIHHPTVPKCTAMGDVAACFTTVAAPYEYSCPDGYLQDGGVCSTVVKDLVIHQCPVGFEHPAEEDCVKSVPADTLCQAGVLKEDGQCHDKELMPPTTTWCTKCVGSDCQVRCD